MLIPMPLDLRMAIARAECDLYSNLVTRATGRAVRGQLEAMLHEMQGSFGDSALICPTADGSIGDSALICPTADDAAVADAPADTPVTVTPRIRLAVLDFSHVGILDFSCADEIVAKLLLRFGAGLPAHAHTPQPPSYFMFRGLAEAHLEALEPVLERHGLALVAEAPDGTMQLVGTVDPEEHRAWQLVVASGGGDVESIASFAVSGSSDLHERLVALARRRLVIQTAAGFHPLRHH
ncbi:MAG: hypothetical protein U5K74_05280 [Gemmatimonadaceae bacterium]|nr:hypothetical protein [Gemmatimonadaceae bacterium]